MRLKYIIKRLFKILIKNNDSALIPLNDIPKYPLIW